MKLLFVIDRYGAQDDPSINLIYNMLPFLRAQGEVDFAGHTTQRERAGEFCFYYAMDERVRALYFSLHGLSAPQKALRLLRHPILSAFGLLKTRNIDLISVAYRRAIERLCRKHGYDAVLSVSAPFYTAKAVAAAHIACQKALILFDPYAAHHLYGNARTARQQARCFAKADAVFVPKLLAHTPGVTTLEFPSLVPLPQPQTRRNAALAYVGSLYADIRNPAPLLRLLQAMGGDAPALTVVGGMYGAYSEEFHCEFDAFIEKHVTLVPKLARAQALEYLCCAQALVSLGNAVANQVPSKIFEYFATGLPIVHIKLLPDCPAAPYMERYPLALCIDAADCGTPEAAARVRAFLRDTAGKRVGFDEVCALYPDALPEAAARTILTALEEARV